MLFISQGCLDMWVPGSITTIKQHLSMYFPDEKNATDTTSIFDCVVECFTQGDQFIYYVSLMIIVVIWIPFHESPLELLYILLSCGHRSTKPLRIVIYIIVMWTPFNRTSVRIVIYMIDLWTPFNKSSVRIVKSIIVLWTLFHETPVGMVMSRRV